MHTQGIQWHIVSCLFQQVTWRVYILGPEHRVVGNPALCGRTHTHGTVTGSDVPTTE